MRQLQLIAHGEPSDVIELNTVSEPALGQEDVLISMEATPLRGTYGVRPASPSPSRRRGCWTSLQNRIELGCFQIIRAESEIRIRECMFSRAFVGRC